MAINYTSTKKTVKKLALSKSTLSMLFVHVKSFSSRHISRSMFESWLESRAEAYNDRGCEEFVKQAFSFTSLLSLPLILLLVITNLITSLLNSTFEFSSAETATGTTQNLAPRLLQSPF